MAGSEGKPRLLLLMTTTTYRAHDFLEAARRLEIDAVIGSDRQQALAALTPGKTMVVDFLHPQAGADAITAYAAERPLDAIVAVDDDGALVAAMAAEALGLPYNAADAVAAAQNKHRMRQLMADAGVPTPQFWCVPREATAAEVAPRISFPCVVKPLFLSASRGVIRADDAGQLEAALRRVEALLRQPEVEERGGPLARHLLIETFIPGREVALEGLLVHGKLNVLALFDKPDALDGPFFEETLYITPSRLPQAVQAAIVACTARTAQALGLHQGPIHAELRLNDTGIWMLELAPRSIGGLCSRTLRFGPGVSLEELILRQAIGLDPTTYEREARASGVMMLPIPGGGILRAVHGQDAARMVAGVEEVDITIPVGDEVVPLPEGNRYLGFVFARGGSPAQVEAALRAAYTQLEIVITPAASR